MNKILDGKLVAKKRKEILRKKIEEDYKKYGRYPTLKVILVGDNPGSLSYVKGKEKASSEVNIITDIISFSNDVSEEELLKKIDELNADNNVDAILVQLPLPKHINTRNILDQISLSKDVDGFKKENQGALFIKEDGLYPCTPLGIMNMLEYYNIDLKGKRCVVIGRSNIVGLPLAKMLLDKDATVTICHSKTLNLSKITKQSDLIVACFGQAKLITKKYIKKGAIIIDVGANKLNNKLCGDVDFDSCYKKASYISKVPGGVGPMTITTLLENCYKIYKNKFNKE